MRIERVQKEHITQAVALALKDYEKQCKALDQIPERDYQEELQGLLTYLFTGQLGVVAVNDGSVLGYLAFIAPIDGFFGNCKGAFSPLGGSAFSGTNRGKLASKLLAAAMEQLRMEQQVTSFAICRYAADNEVCETLSYNGFGIRCSDGMMRLRDADMKIVHNPKLSYRELKGQERRQIHGLRLALAEHMRGTPIYMNLDTTHYEEWYTGEEVRVFAAYDGEEVVCFLSLAAEAENYISDSPEVININGAYVKETYRGRKIADDLLAYVCQTCRQEGYGYLGVDCETLNPTALHFWRKYFQSYTYSWHRRIDERTLASNQ